MMKHQTCAACKFQRKRCTPDCTMAPYFPANKSAQFLNAHKLFGVSKLTKTLNSLPPHLRPTSMSTMCAEAEHRAKDPVGGCYHVVLSLLGLINQFEDELHRVRSQLYVFRCCGDNVVVQDLEEDKLSVVQELHEYDPQLLHQLQNGIVPQPHQEERLESNVFGLRDEVVLDQDVNPIQDKGEEERDVKVLPIHSSCQLHACSQ